MRKLIPWLGQVAAMVCMCFSMARADLNEGLVGYYPFDDGTGDVLVEQTGNGTNGELFNFDFDWESNWSDGLIGGSLAFDGIDDYVIAPDFPLADTALSVSIWGNASSSDNPWMSLVKNWGGSLVGQFHFGLGTGASDTLNIFITQSDGVAINAGTDLDDIELKTWEHYAFVANPDEETVTLYRNGEVVDDSGAYDGGFTDAANDSGIGIGVKTNNDADMADPGNPGYWHGHLDDLGIWHRALTADEITDIYTRGLTGRSAIGSDGAVALQPGDSDQDLDFDQLDLVQVQIASKYLTGGAATWGEGDWNGAPGGQQGEPPAGDGLFDQIDIISALSAGKYLTGPYAAVAAGGTEGDGQTSVIYDASTGEVAVDAPAGTDLTSINVDSAAGIFTGDAAQNLGGSFDNDADDNIFKATFGSSFGSVSFGNVAQTGLSEGFVLGDLSVVGSLAGGGDLGDVDLVYVPEPTAALLLIIGAAIGILRFRRAHGQSENFLFHQPVARDPSRNTTDFGTSVEVP